MLKEVQTYTVRIYMAGDIVEAKRLLRHECYREGLCVTIEPCDFIYTGGEEAGFVVGLLNYPRFPSEPVRIFERAKRIAEGLMPFLNQRSALLVSPDKTVWIQERPPGEQ